MSNGVPQIFPPLPINLPGADGSNQGPVATQDGTVTDSFAPTLPQDLAEVFNTRKVVPVEPIVYNPPLNFQVK